MSENPPKPRLSLTVGIIGHRPNRLPEAARDKVAADIAGVLDRIGDAARNARGQHREFFSSSDPLLSLVSALAEGADRIAAEAALAQGWVLDAVLPFSAEVYQTDFKTSESVSAFDGLLHRARSVLVLPGQRHDETRAYESAGATVLDRSDMLLLVWDHGPSAGGGGTTQMLDTAARLDIPIIYVDAKGEAPPRVQWGQIGDFPTPEDVLDHRHAHDLDHGLKTLMEKLVDPPSLDAERRELKRYFCEGSSGYNLRLEFPFLMAVCGVRAVRKTDWRPFEPRLLADELLKLGASGTAGETPGEPLVLANAYGWTDAVGIRFAQVFRSAFVMNFLLASIAVIVAVSSILFDHEKKYLFVSFELLLIAFVLANTIVGRWRAWHRRWFEPREVAERLRIALALWTLGARPRSFSGKEPAWTGWYARAIIREQSPCSGKLDNTRLVAGRAVLLALISEQCRYHSLATERMEQLEHRLELFGLILFGATAFTAVAYLAANLYAHVTDSAAFLVTVFAASLPALATATYGIRIIGDFEGIARRSKRTHDALQQLIKAISDDPLALELLRARARLAAEVMLGDVASWRVAAESRGLNIPG
jgi:hypothetical protein